MISLSLWKLTSLENILLALLHVDVSGNPILPAGQQIMWNAATMQQQPAISSPMISPVAPPTVNMADLVAMPTSVNIQNLSQIQQRPIAHLPQVVVIKWTKVFLQRCNRGIGSLSV